MTDPSGIPAATRETQGRSGYVRIEIDFPLPVDLPDDFQRRLNDLLGEVCAAYKRDHPDRTMWVFGVGDKITYMPMTQEDEQERGMEFDSSVLHFEIAERENYRRQK